ncbi:helix-turn-helix transcriptional regulator [Sporosarcina sp. E16_8]|uniref:helix-turn-helix domain-containing protein n=1 Tax=Sporosarcina sp. E16_8 TaxID=2789295 RepID=UPI0021071975|nr:helix-turn-helix transcriptional regulator [Sporosarcina sp. E16_8]
MLKKERISRGLTIPEAATNIGIDLSLWESIENGSRALNTKSFALIGLVLNMTQEELLAEENDDLGMIAFRTTNKGNAEIIKTIEMANLIFDEIIMQEKIGVR